MRNKSKKITRKRERPVESMLRGVRQVTAWAKGDERVPLRVNEVYPVDVRAIRARLNLSQSEFAEKFGFPLGTVKNWEQGRRVPERSAQILLTIVDRNPEIVEALLCL